MPKIKSRDGTELYVKDWGSGRPVILMHGWPLSADSWDDQAMAIADAGMRAIAYDRRGFGRSDQPGRAMITTRWPTIWPMSLLPPEPRMQRWPGSRWVAARWRAICRGMAAQTSVRLP